MYAKESLIVAYLINHEAQACDEALLSMLFYEKSKEAILQPPVLFMLRPDKLIWIVGKKVVFSVKSTYFCHEPTDLLGVGEKLKIYGSIN